MASKTSDSLIRFAFMGDVMLGRLIDQLFPHCVTNAQEKAHALSLLSNRNPEQYHLVQKGKWKHAQIWGDVLSDVLLKSDIRIINLETSVTTHSNPWPNKAFNYRMHPANLEILSEAHIDYCSLANNHVLDFSLDGMKETIESLSSRNICFAGVGDNINSASKPAILEWKSQKDTVRVACFSISDHPAMWAATQTNPGIHYLDIEHYRPEDIERLRRIISEAVETHHVNLVIVSLHWGPNYCWSPSDSFRRFAHELIDHCRVDIIHGHSSHHVQGIEFYCQKPILYGCGDFVDDYAVDAEYRNDLGFLYLVTMDWYQRHVISIELVPTSIVLFTVTKTLPKKDLQWLTETMTRLCQPLGTIVERRIDSDTLRVLPI